MRRTIPRLRGPVADDERRQPVTSAATAEIVNIDSAIGYLQGLGANVEHTCNTEIEILLAGLGNAGLDDPDVIGNINNLRDGLTGALGNIAAAIDRLGGAHRAVAETVSAAGQDNVAKDTTFYGAQ